MQRPIDRRAFLNSVAVGAAAAATGSATYFAGPRPANAAPKVKGNVPDTPFKTGHITFLTGPANLLGEPGRKGPRPSFIDKMPVGSADLSGPA